MNAPVVTLVVDLARVQRLVPESATEPASFDFAVRHQGSATVYVVLDDDDPFVFHVPGDIDYGTTILRIEARR